MNRKECITVTQLVSMLFISRVITSLTYSPFSSGESQNILDHVISAVISFFLVILMALPCYLLYKSDKRSNAIEKSVFLSGKCGAVFALVYILYFFFACCHALSMFNIFMSNVMDPKISLWIVSAAVVLVSCYGAKKGIEGLARTTFVVMIMIVAGIIFLIFALVPKVDTLNYTPMIYNGINDMKNGVIMLVAQSFCIPALGLLLPFVKGNVKGGIVFWSFASNGIFIVMIILMVGSLGDFLKTQMFPFYCAASVAEIGALRRLDAVYLGLWTSGLFCKISLFLFLISLAVKSVWSEKTAKVCLFTAGALTVIFSCIISCDKYIYNLFFNINMLLFFTAFVSIVPPLLLIILRKFKPEDKCYEF